MSVDVSTTQSPVAVSVNDTTVSVVVTGGIGPQGPAGGGYTLPAATASILGGIKVGSNLSVTADGTLSATGGGGGAVSSVAGRTGDVTLTTADIGGLGSLATQSGTFSGTSSGTNTGDQTITLTGDVTGSGTGSFSATLAASGATAGTYTSVTVDTKGRVTAGTNPAGYSLPTATASVLGGIKIGSGLSIDGSGVVTAAAASTDASLLTTGTLSDARLSSNVALASNIALAANSTESIFDVLDRRFVTAATVVTSGRVYYTFFTPVKSFTVSNIAFANVSAFSGLTLARFGIYTFNETTATLVARTASSTSTLGTGNAINTLSLDTDDGYPATYTLEAGTRYGVAFLAVGTGMGSISAQVSANSPLTNTSPRTSAYIQAQSDLPSSAAGFLSSGTGQQFFARLT